MIDRIRLPFEEQIEFFRQKLNLPTERWDDILKSAHDRAFIVAGAMNADLLDDLRQAVDATLANGDTLNDFRKKFRQTVAKHGWTGWTGEGTKAGEAWRTRVIYQTNIATSHAAGRWQQLNDPELLKLRPYWRYVHNDSVLSPRPHHKAWGDSGLTLLHDHPFWQTHFPPNGWGCRCRVTAVKAPGEHDATTPPDGWDTRNEKGQLPGIDTGWDYAPGANTDMPLRQMVQDKLVRLPEAIGKALSHELHKHVVANADPAGFARLALTQRQAKADLWLGFVGDNPGVRTVSGKDLPDYLVLVPADAVRHTQIEHGRDNRAQREPLPEDYADAARWLVDGEITPNVPGPLGHVRMKAIYRANGEEVHSVWEIRPGKRNRAVSLITMWVRR